MSFDPDELQYLRSSFWRMADPVRHRDVEAAKGFRKKLADMGFDLNDDATYELLQDGLTKQKFDDLEYLALTHLITRQFNTAQDLSWQQYSGLTAQSRYSNTKELIRLLDHYAATLKSRTLPADADLYHGTILNMIVTDYDSGRLQEYCDGLAVPAAVEAYQGLQESWKNTRESLKEKNAGGNLNYYNEFYPVKSLKKMLAGMTEARREAVFAQTGTSPEELDKTHREIALALVRVLLTSWQGQPVPRLESGHTSDHGYQYALEEFEVAGVDMNDDTTYDAIGMDRQTFWDNYQTQVEWLQTSANKPSKVFKPPQP